MSRIFYRVFNALPQSDIPPDAGDFRLMDRSVVAALSNYRERTWFMKGLFSAVGFKTAHVVFDTPARQVGATKWSYWRLWNLALDGIFKLLDRPDPHMDLCRRADRRRELALCALDRRDDADPRP